MWISYSIFILSVTSSLVKSFGNEEIVGKGRWLVLNILPCKNADQYELHLDMQRKKINRTHDCFNLELDLDRELNSTYGIEFIAEKEVDGGFKYYTTLSDSNFCKFAAEYAGDNFARILTMANIEPADCPIPKGNIRVDNFVFDYKQISKEGIYGTFDVEGHIFILGRKVMCARWIINFEKQRESEDDDDDYD